MKMAIIKPWILLHIVPNLPRPCCYLFVFNSFLIFVNLPDILLSQSQTQCGTRYTPHLTRFYASMGPTLLMQFIQESLEALNVKCKVGSPREDPDGTVTYRLRIGGYDRRKLMFKGWVDVEAFSYRQHKGSFCVMQRDIVSVISFLRLGIED